MERFVETRRSAVATGEERRRREEQRRKQQEARPSGSVCLGHVPGARALADIMFKRRTTSCSTKRSWRGRAFRTSARQSPAGLDADDVVSNTRNVSQLRYSLTMMAKVMLLPWTLPRSTEITHRSEGRAGVVHGLRAGRRS